MKTGRPWKGMVSEVGKGMAVAAAALLLSLLGLVGVGHTNVFAASSLPGGASSLQETYQDWQVRCASQEDGALCRLVQQQVTQDTGQRLLTVEMVITEEGGLTGTVALPLGLRLAAGVTFQVDDGQTSQPLPFSTCVPQGCLVPFTPDEAVTAQLREGESLKLVAGLLDGRTIQFAVSLNGFAAALDRLQALEASM